MVTTVGGRDEKTMDAQTESVDIRMGKTRTRGGILLPHPVSNRTRVLSEVLENRYLQACMHDEDITEHTFFVCPQWIDYREHTDATIDFDSGNRRRKNASK